MSAVIEQRNQDATIYVGNLDEKMNEELLWEMMLQVGPVVNVHMPKDKVRARFLHLSSDLNLLILFRSRESMWGMASSSFAPRRTPTTP